MNARFWSPVELWIVLLVDDYDMLSAADPLRPAAALPAVGPRPGVHVILARPVIGAAGPRTTALSSLAQID